MALPPTPIYPQAKDAGYKKGWADARYWSAFSMPAGVLFYPRPSLHRSRLGACWRGVRSSGGCRGGGGGTPGPHTVSDAGANGRGLALQPQPRLCSPHGPSSCPKVSRRVKRRFGQPQPVARSVAMGVRV